MSVVKISAVIRVACNRVKVQLIKSASRKYEKCRGNISTFITLGDKKSTKSFPTAEISLIIIILLMVTR